MKTVLKEIKPCKNRESKSNEITIYLYSCHYINIKILAVVTPLSIYHGYSTRKTFCEEKFTGKNFFFCLWKWKIVIMQC